MAKKNKDSKLDILNQTRDRTPMPRPTVFDDQTKYKRRDRKKELQDEEDDWWLDEELDDDY